MSGEKWVVYSPEDGIIACCPSQSEAVEILQQLRRRLTQFAREDGEWGDYCEGAFVARMTHELELDILSTTGEGGEAEYDLVIRQVGQGGDE